LRNTAKENFSGNMMTANANAASLKETASQLFPLVVDEM
jgi:hypothetical protein